jgi:hypothetical protein
MFWRKSLVLLTLVFLVAFTLPLQASEPHGGGYSQVDSIWELIWKFIPRFGHPPAEAPQKTGAGIDPDGDDSGPGMDPNGFVGTSGAGIDPNGNEVSPAMEPDGFSVEDPQRSPAIEPNGGN